MRQREKTIGLDAEGPPTRNVLPLSLPPRGLSRVEAARYIGVSPSLFDAMVKEGAMPGPKRIHARVVWDRVRLDACFSAIPDGEEDAPNVWHSA